MTSRHEGGPQAVLEASQTRTKILSTDVGIASQVLHPDCICASAEEFEEKIRSDAITDEHVEYNYESVQKLRIENLIESYDSMIDEVCDV